MNLCLYILANGGKEEINKYFSKVWYFVPNGSCVAGLFS